MKLFRIRGGIHPEYRKELSSESAIVRLPMPARLLIPLRQHIGAPAEPLVVAGNLVGKGQMIARSDGPVSAPIHAPTSGRIISVVDATAPHPSGLSQPTIVLEPDGRDAWADLPEPLTGAQRATPQAIAERAGWAGIVGMGGATFPSAIKLNLGEQRTIDTLLINGAECEPYLTCDDRVMREHADEVIDGARLMAHALGAARVVIAIEDNKPQALGLMRQAAVATEAALPVEVIAVPVQYPMGSERHLVQAITGRETPARKLTADLGVVVHNVATARAIQQAVRHGRPLTERVVTVSGGAVRVPKNLEVLIGTPVAELIAFCGGLSTAPARLINGGPMMGQPLPGIEVPVVKGTSGILALTAAETHDAAASPCIRCGTCVSICPCGLSPIEMAANIRKDKLEAAAKLGVNDCVCCGSCSWACPSHIPLVQYFHYAKGSLADAERERQRSEKTRTLAEARNTRLEKAAAARRAVAAARKAKTAGAAPAPTNAEAAGPAPQSLDEVTA